MTLNPTPTPGGFPLTNKNVEVLNSVDRKIQELEEKLGEATYLIEALKDKLRHLRGTASN